MAERTWAAAERARTETALRQSEARYRNLAEMVPAIVWESDDEKVDYFNQRWFEYTGLDWQAGVGEAWHGVIHPDDAAEAVRRSLEAARTGRAYEMDYRLRRADGQYRHHLARAVRDPSTGRWTGTAVDIHELSEAQAALRESEERFRQFAEHSGDVLWVWNTAGQGVEYVSPAVAQVWGLTPEQVTADLQALYTVLHPEDRDWAPAAMPRVLAGETVIQEYRAARPGTGEVRWLHDTAFPIRDALGRIHRAGGIAQDITEQKEAEEALRAREELQTFLLRFSDALRAEITVDAVANRALALLAEHLHLDRCCMATYHLEDDRADFSYQVGNDRVPPLPSGIRLSDFPEAFRVLFDQTLVIDDVASTVSLSAVDRHHMTGLGMGALVAVTLGQGEGRPLWCIVAVSAGARRWTPNEIALIEEATERTWVVMERARVEQVLRESEEKLRTVFESIDEAFGLVDIVRDEAGVGVDYRLLEANRVFERQTGITNATGKLASEYVPGEEAFWLEQFDRVSRTGEPVRLEQYHQATQHWHTAFVVRVGGADSNRVAIVFNDITERKHREAHQALLVELSRDLSRAFGEEELLDAVGAKLAAHLNLSCYHYLDVDEERGEVTVRHFWHALDIPSVLGTYPIDGFIAPERLSGLRAGETTVIHDIQETIQGDSPARAGLRAGAEAHKIGAYIAVPYSQDGRWKAYFAVADHQARRWTTSELELIQDVARQLFPRIERVRAEAALAESEGRLRALIEQLPGGAVFVVDHDLRYVLAQGEALSIAGYGPEDLLGRTVAQAMPPEVVGEYEALYRQALAGEGFEYEHAAHGRAFITREVPLRTRGGAISAVLAMSYDITDRKQAEDALRETEGRLEAIFEVLPVGVGFVDTEGRLLLSNQELYRYLPTGLLPSRDPERQGRWMGLDAQDQRVEPHNFPCARALRGEWVVPGMEMLYTQDDGADIWTRVAAVPLRDATGQITGQVHVIMDVNALKRAEEELRALNTDLEARVEERTRRLADLNAELGNVITRTAHNLEAPAQRLGRLLESGTPALEELSLSDPQVVQDEVTRLRGVAQDLRHLAHLEQQVVAKDLLPLGELFGAVQAEAATTARGQKLYWHLEPLPIVRGDRDLLRQALDVLMTFTLSETRGARYVTVSSRMVAGEIQVTVEDDGLGLTGEEAATLFDLAVRTDQEVPVLDGSGLIQVRRILARHGGWAWAEAQRTSGKVVLAFPKDETVNEMEAFFRPDTPGL